MGGITVVVPVYNVEKYLDECVESIVNQTYRDLEIILVEDGSPDGCPQMCDAWAKRDGRIRVIHQDNKGLGPARNAGMAMATGEYIGFVDSDDWIEPEMYRKLYEAAKRCDADIAVSGHRDVAGGRVVTTKVHPLAGQTLVSEEEIHNVRKRLFGHVPWEKEVEAFPMSVCMSLYRNDMIRMHNLQFCEIMSEDTIFNLDAYRHAKGITFTDGTDYCYRKENQISITQSFSHGKGQRFLHFLLELARLAEKEDEECILRAKRMAIDYCRLYVGQVASSNVSFREKTTAIRQFALQEGMRECWEGYPVNTLPVQQRIFQKMIAEGRYEAALLLNWLRRNIRKGLGKN